MKNRKQRVLGFICVFIMFFSTIFLNIEKVYAIADETAEQEQTRITNETEESMQSISTEENTTQENESMRTATTRSNAHTTINSQTLLESNDLDSLKLNITTLPVVTVTGTAKYTIADSAKFTPSEFKARSVTFRDVSSRR